MTVATSHNVMLFSSTLPDLPLISLNSVAKI